MDRLTFVTAPPVTASIHPARADVACFVGYVARRAGTATQERRRLQAALEQLQWHGPDLPGAPDGPVLPTDILATETHPRGFAPWLQGLGWRPLTAAEQPTSTPASAHKLFGAVLRMRFPASLVDWWEARGDLAPTSRITALDFLELRDLPVPIETWETFDAWFAWNVRAIDPDAATPSCDTYLGAAVRSFFAQGGRLCYVVRLGDPWPVRAPTELRRAQASHYLPTLPPVSSVDRSTWRGLGHLHGLPGISLLALPDLPDLFGVSSRPRDRVTPPEGPEIFVECATRAAPAEQRFLRGVSVPRSDEDGFRAWREFVVRVGGFLANPANRLREIQFVTAVPLPVDAAAVAVESDAADRVARAARAQWTEVAQIQTAFVQLAYPWLRTAASRVLPDNIVPPDGVLTGLLARTALVDGSWQSLIQQSVPGVSAVEPILDRPTLARDLGPGAATVREHVSILGPTARGIRVLSDVTTDDDPIYRPASVNRLVIAILRAARVAGDDFVFASNGEGLWRRLRESLESVLASLWADGALLGESAKDAFEVRCDRSTMTQADLDAGRLIARIAFTASRPIEHITVVLAMNDAGQVTLQSASAVPATEAA